jgi:hypothetical protein
MSSRRTGGFRYIRDRCVNAYWMLRTGKFKLIAKSIYIELAHRIEVVRTLLSKPKPLHDSQVPYSAFIDRRRVLPPSYRPTTAQPPLQVPLRADTAVIARDLRRIVATFSIAENTDP